MFALIKKISEIFFTLLKLFTDTKSRKCFNAVLAGRFHSSARIVSRQFNRTSGRLKVAQHGIRKKVDGDFPIPDFLKRIFSHKAQMKNRDILSFSGWGHDHYHSHQLAFFVIK
jgi:hypothetical protein